MQIMKRFVTVLVAAVLFAAGQATGYAAEVEVGFSGKLTRNMDRLNEIEKEREINFRKYLDDIEAAPVRSDRRFDRTKFSEVAWAGETLIPDINNYTVENFLKALVKEDMKRAGFDDVEGTIRLKIDRIKVANHSLSFVSNSRGFDPQISNDIHFSGVVSRDGTTSPGSNIDTYVLGSIEQLDENGTVVKSVKVTATLVYDTTVDNNYQGPGFAFSVTDPSERVGPALTYFVKKGLDKLFDTDAFYGPVVVGP